MSRHIVGSLTSAKPILYDYIISKKLLSFYKKTNAAWMLISPSLKLSEAAIALLYVPPSLFDIIRYKFNDSCCISYTNLYI